MYLERNMTKKELYKNFRAVYWASYASLQNLLDPRLKIGRNVGQCGWNWSAYTVGTNVIITGYRNLTGKEIPDSIARKYDHLGKMAEEKYAYSQWLPVKEKLLFRLLREVEGSV